MLKPNTRYKELKDTYLFNTIYRKTNEYLEANPDKQVCKAASRMAKSGT